MRATSVVLVSLLLAACAAPGGSLSPASFTATPSATVDPDSAPTASGHQGLVIHIDLRVPIRSATADAIGSSCDIESLRATGPEALKIPGADFSMIDFAEAQRQAASQDELVIPTVAIVPASGTVVELTGDPDFVTACSFTFDVPDDANTQTWVFGVDPIYIPVPLIPRDVLEATNGTAIIIVNPQ
jgi:hypothetical protein